MKLFQRVNSHPVHILDKYNNLSPSSFIPFCSFGGDMESVGTNIKEIDIPVCNIFQAVIRNDQLCYEADLNKLKDDNDIKVFKQLQLGLVLLLDYNVERQLDLDGKKGKQKMAKKNIIRLNDELNEARIFLDTISINPCFKIYDNTH